MAKQLHDLFELTYRVIGLNLKGVSHEESLISPEPGGNCINWVLGHIVVSRKKLLALLGEEMEWGEEESALYERGSQPVGPEDSVESLERLMELLATSQERLLGLLGGGGESIVGRDGQDLTWEIFTYHFHETYHAGQLGLLRRIVGKKGAIR